MRNHSFRLWLDSSCFKACEGESSPLRFFGGALISVRILQTRGPEIIMLGLWNIRAMPTFFGFSITTFKSDFHITFKPPVFSEGSKPGPPAFDPPSFWDHRASQPQR